MPVLKVGALMRYYIKNQPELKVEGNTVLQVLENTAGQYPEFRFHLFDSSGNLRRHFNVYLNGQHVRELHGLQTHVEDGDQIMLLAAVAGG
jgi:molybdopterin synthase sulfur carrier subunit